MSHSRTDRNDLRTPVPAVVIAREDTETNSGATIGKKLNTKELHRSSEDLLTEFFALDKIHVSRLNSSISLKNSV